MDLRLSLDNKEPVNVEMQLCLKQYFKERVLFYGSKNYFSQLNKGEEYGLLHPSYSLIFCDFNLFKSKRDKFCRSFSFREDERPHELLRPRNMRVVFVELPKFRLKIKDLFDNRQAWCYLLRWFEKMGEKDKELFSARGRGMEELMDWTRPLTLEESEQILEEAREKNRRDLVAREQYVFAKGKRQGKRQGKAEGKAQGIEQVALKMLSEKVRI